MLLDRTNCNSTYSSIVDYVHPVFTIVKLHRITVVESEAQDNTSRRLYLTFTALYHRSCSSQISSRGNRPNI